MILSKQRLFARLYRKPDDGDGESGSEQVVDSSAGSGAIGTGNDDRIARLAAINDANDRANADELADVTDDGKTIPFVAPIDEDADVVPVVAVEEETTPVIEEEPATPVEKKFKLKVNGKELELTEAEVIARAQKVESADQYLADAKRAVAPPTPAPVAGPTEEELRAARELEDRAIVRAIQMGTEEEALTAIRQLSARQARPSVTADDVSLAIDQRLVFNEAISQFRKDFSDIAGDPVLYQLAQQRDDALIESGDKRPYAERYAQIGKELRSWKEGLAPKSAEAAPEVPKDTSLADKKARKDAAPKTPVAATGKVKQVVPEEDDGEENPSDVIRSMQKQRGGPAWMRT